MLAGEEHLLQAPGLLLLQPLLLAADDGAGAADADVADGLMGREAVVLHHVRADEQARPAQPSFAVDCQRACEQTRLTACFM